MTTRFFKDLHPRKGIASITHKVIRQETQEWWIEFLTTMAMPVTYYLAFGFGLRGYIHNVEGVSYTTFLIPGLISLAILMEAYKQGAWGLWLDRWHQGMVDEYRIKPISALDIILGQILGSFVMAIFKGGITALILLLLMPVQLSWGNFIPYLVMMVAGTIFFTSIGTMVGVTYPKPDHIAHSQVIVITPLLYLGGLFFPITAFPEAVVPWLKLLPTTALFEGGRMALIHGIWDPQYLFIVWFFAVLAMGLSTYWFQHKLSE